jgi:hypothetical protein
MEQLEDYIKKKDPKWMINYHLKYQLSKHKYFVIMVLMSWGMISDVIQSIIQEYIEFGLKPYTEQPGLNLSKCTYSYTSYNLRGANLIGAKMKHMHISCRLHALISNDTRINTIYLYNPVYKQIDHDKFMIKTCNCYLCTPKINPFTSWLNRITISGYHIEDSISFDKKMIIRIRNRFDQIGLFLLKPVDNRLKESDIFPIQKIQSKNHVIKNPIIKSNHKKIKIISNKNNNQKRTLRF